MEHMLIIGLRGDGPPIDFTCLAQPSLERAQTRGGGMVLDTARGQLHRTALYGKGGTRGLDLDIVENYVVRTLSWTVLSE